MLYSHLRHQRTYGDLYDLLLWVQLFNQLLLNNGGKRMLRVVTAIPSCGRSEYPTF